MTLAEDVNLEEFVMTKDEFSGADIKAICTEAGLLALRERRMKVLFFSLKLLFFFHFNPSKGYLLRLAISPSFLSFFTFFIFIFSSSVLSPQKGHPLPLFLRILFIYFASSVLG